MHVNKEPFRNYILDHLKTFNCCVKATMALRMAHSVLRIFIRKLQLGKTVEDVTCRIWLKQVTVWRVVTLYQDKETNKNTSPRHTQKDLSTKRSTAVLKYYLHLAVSDPMSCFPTLPPWRGSDEHPATPGLKHQPTGSPLDPLSSTLALVNTIIAVLCSCGLRVNTVAVKGHHAPSKDDGSLKWALSVAAIFHLTGPTHEGDW